MLLLGFLLISGGSAVATATTWVASRPHNPAHACAAIEGVIAEMTGKKADDDFLPFYFNDEFGLVGHDEREAFFRSMITSEGKSDQSAIVITNVWPVGKREDKDAKALYVVGLQRDQWLPERENIIDPMQMEPEGYTPVPSYWLAEFAENRVISFREGYHFFDFVDYDKRLTGCANG